MSPVLIYTWREGPGKTGNLGKDCSKWVEVQKACLPGSYQGKPLSWKQMSPMDRSEQKFHWSMLVTVVILKPKVKNMNQCVKKLTKSTKKLHASFFIMKSVSIFLDELEKYLIAEAGSGSNLKWGAGQNVIRDRKSLKLEALRKPQSNFSSKFSVMKQAYGGTSCW